MNRRRARALDRCAGWLRLDRRPINKFDGVFFFSSRSFMEELAANETTYHLVDFLICCRWYTDTISVFYFIGIYL